MIPAAINYIIKWKNPHFRLHPQANSGILLQLALTKGMAWLRGRRLWLRAKRPGLLFLGKGVRFFNLAKIHFGKWVQLEKQVYLNAWSTSGIWLGDNVRIGAYSQVITSTNFASPGEGIKIGNNVGIGEYAYLGGAGGLEIGDDCIIGQYFSCHPENHHFEIEERPFRLQGVTRKGIKIGRNCWIGAKVTILDGVQVGDNCVIAAGAVVTRSMPDNTVIGGIPARVLKSVPEKNANHLPTENQICTSEQF